jgi:hypothetical protein
VLLDQARLGSPLLADGGNDWYDDDMGVEYNQDAAHSDDEEEEEE